jgi:hypothetical protein
MNQDNYNTQKLPPGFGIAVGLASGVVIGVALDNIALGVGPGLCLGAVLEAQHEKPALGAKMLKGLLGFGIVFFVLALVGTFAFLGRR